MTGFCETMEDYDHFAAEDEDARWEREHAGDFAAYSTATHTTLAFGPSLEVALALGREVSGGADEFLIVARVSNGRALVDDIAGGSLPEGVEIVWRGANDKAQTFRT